MKTTLLTLTLTGLLSSGAALAYEDSMQRDSKIDVRTMLATTVARMAKREATAPGAPGKSQLPDASTQGQPDPHMLPYVNGGWYGQ